MAERCLRTPFMSTMSAPDASSRRFVSILSASEMPVVGNDRQSRAAAGHQGDDQIAGTRRTGHRQQAQTAGQARLVGQGMGRLEHFDVAQRVALA